MKALVALSLAVLLNGCSYARLVEAERRALESSRRAYPEYWEPAK